MEFCIIRWRTIATLRFGVFRFVTIRTTDGEKEGRGRCIWIPVLPREFSNTRTRRPELPISRAGPRPFLHSQQVFGARGSEMTILLEFSAESRWNCTMRPNDPPELRNLAPVRLPIVTMRKHSLTILNGLLRNSIVLP